MFKLNEVEHPDVKDEKRLPEGGGADYILGHSQEELRRLAFQSRFFGELTEQVFRSAGIERGMRVLDVGCGAGDVSFLAAEMVGAQGWVIGVDRGAEAIATARERARDARLANVTFIQGDLNALSFERPFDALVGRLVLLYQPDPVDALKRLAQLVGPGGLLVFQEMDMSGFKSYPAAPLFKRAAGWIEEGFRRGQADTMMGLKLYQTFLSAGLPAPQMIMHARIEGGADSPAYEVLTQVLRTLLPRIEQLGVARADEVRIDTLASRLRDEVVAGGGVIIVPPLVGAWARKPG